MVSGVSGQPGVPAVRPAVRAPVTGRGNVILPQLLTAANHVVDHNWRKRIVKVRKQRKHNFFNLKKLKSIDGNYSNFCNFSCQG